MHDADYYHFFEAEYFELLHDLRKEIAAMMDLRFNDQEWFSRNATFLSHHCFYTALYQEQWIQQKHQLLAENNQRLSLVDSDMYS